MPAHLIIVKLLFSSLQWFPGYEFEALMAAHDGVATTLPPDSTTPPPQSEIPAPPLANHRYGTDDNIKIIRIEKTTEPLGATVRNEGEAVVIGE